MIQQGKKITIIFVTYNDIQNFDACFSSLEEQTYRNFEVIISDNGSTDGSLEYFREKYPEYKIFENGRNLGYAGGNNVGFRHGTGDYFLVLNNDVELECTFLEQLVRGMENDPETRIATPKILLFDNREKINCIGNRVHFTGMTFCNKLYEHSADYAENLYTNNFSGACFILSRQWLEELGGGYDTDYGNLYTPEVWSSLEDVDFSFRTQLKGYKILCVSSAVMYHKYIIKFIPRKLFFLECGRYLLVVENYPLHVILAFLPGFLLMEIVVLGYSLMKGKKFFMAKLKSYWWLIKNRNRLAEKRCKNKPLLKSGHRELFRSLSYKISIGELVEKNLVLKFLEHFVNGLFYLLFVFGCFFIRQQSPNLHPVNSEKN